MYKMNIITVIYQLQLPSDSLDLICSFLFYTLNECIERYKQKNKKMLNDITQIETNYVDIPSRTKKYYMNILYPLREHKVIHTYLCGVCGNFINIFRINSFGCKC
jgi:hypothetical protein